MEVFLDKRVRETRKTAGANSRRGAKKKREISRTLLSINLHFSVQRSCTVHVKARRVAVSQDRSHERQTRCDPVRLSVWIGVKEKLAPDG